MIYLKRVYDPPQKEDGQRILVDRIWPRGLSKDEAKLDRWAKQLAPSTELRKWFGHDPQKWSEFQRRYQEELQACKDELEELATIAKKENITFLYAAKDIQHNNAVALKAIVERLKA